MAHQLHTLPAIDRATRDLDDLTHLIVGLALLRDPDASRPWRPPVIDAYRRAELDHEARKEWQERSGLAPGEHPDAARPDVLDALSGILWRAVQLADHISRAAWLPVLRPPAADADPRPYLIRAARYLPAACAGWTNGDQLAWWAADLAREMARDVAAALALVHDGQHLQMVCPWCSGGLYGARTWRVRSLPGDLVAIVCEGDQPCEPPSKDVGTWIRGRPAWPMAEWEWLARRITAIEAA